MLPSVRHGLATRVHLHDAVSLKVLIVDDHLPSAELMAIQLQSLGADVTVCHQSGRAIQLVQEQGFDGIFDDAGSRWL